MGIKYKVSNTAERLAEIMERENMKQVDIINRCKPYLKQYGVKMNKSGISQYLAGKSEPNQRKLAVLSEALGVSPDWLMGFGKDLPKFKNDKFEYIKNITVNKKNVDNFRKKLSLINEKSEKYKVNSFKKSFISYLQDLDDVDWETIERFTDILIKIKEKI